MAKKSIFSWDPETYTIQALESIARGANRDDWSAIKTEYTRLRDIAHKRITRLGQSEFKKSAAYQAHKQDFPKLRDLDPRDIPAAMSEIVKFLTAKTSTVSGQRSRRAKTIRAWQEQGLDLNEKNYNKVMAAMKEMRSRKILYGSDKVVTLVQMSQEKGWNFNKVLKSGSLDKLLAHADELGEIPKQAGKNLDEYVRRETGW